MIKKSSYDTNELMDISGSGARMSATVTIKIFDSEGIKVDELKEEITKSQDDAH